jgi:4-amino-4-deoxy-L-arabinose transferase-like glycosyltransferase
MEERKNNVNFIHLGIAGILIVATVVKLYFLNLVKDQAHWWDTLAYASLAKNLVLHKWSDLPFILHETAIRPPLLPLIWSWFIRGGFSDYAIILFTGVIPSIVAIYLIYLIGKEMYNNRVGIIAATLASVSWIHIFYASRIMTDIAAMTLTLTSIYFFLKSYEALNLKEWTISVFFLALAVLMRYSYAVFAGVYLVFLFVVKKKEIIKNKSFWYGGVLGSAPIILFILKNIFSTGSFLPAASTYAESAQNIQSFAFYTLGFIPHILRGPLAFLFILGFGYILFRTLLSFGLYSKTKQAQIDLFNVLCIVAILSFFIFIIKAAEDRYLMGLSAQFFVLSAFVVWQIRNIVSWKKKEVGAIIIVLLIVWSGYAQLSFGHSLMLDKKESYRQMKDAFVWISLNTPSDAVIAGDWADPYAIYYSNRKVQPLTENISSQTFNFHVDYIVLTRVHQPTAWVVNYVNQLVEEKKAEPIKAFFFDKEQKQPAVIIYRIVSKN